MSLPPALWEDAAALPAVTIRQTRTASVDLMLSMIWGARNEGVKEPFKAKLTASGLKPVWTHTEDGWSLPLWRYPPKPGASGEPLVLAADLCLSPLSLDLSEGRSLARHFHQLGYDVYVFGHRGHSEAIRPKTAPIIDFDHIISHDVPAAIATIKAISGAKKVHWVGHGFGGQCLVGHLSQDGCSDIAAAALISTPVRFTPRKATLKRAAAIADLLPDQWRLPTQKIQEILTVASKTRDLSHLSLRIEGPIARALLMDATTDLAVGLIRQVNTWHKTGHLTDQTNRFDYLEGIAGRRASVLVIGSPSDQRCPAEAAKPVVDKLADGYGKWLCMPDGWGHLDLIAGADAPRLLFPEIEEWLKKYNARCWSDA